MLVTLVLSGVVSEKRMYGSAQQVFAAWVQPYTCIVRTCIECGKMRGHAVIREVFHTGKIIKGVQEEAAVNAASRVCHEKPYEYKKNHKERATFNWTGLHHSGSGQGEGSFPPGLERPIVSLRHQRH